MPVVAPDRLVALQRKPEEIRNICILAHVDHGKTSLTDALIATNGIISPKLAGKIRYLDSRPDEQVRGITMESSAISLFFSMMRRLQPKDQSDDKDMEPVRMEYLINLIDSPGHIDFSSEVSTASRLCDGAVVLVDAVEGVCSQTVTVLRQTWIEKLKPILVINKMDRLITELQMSPSEAYTHLSRLLEQVNAVMGSFFQGERMEDDLRWRERMEERVTAKMQSDPNGTSDAYALTNGSKESSSTKDDERTEASWEEKDDEDIYFAPEKNNVIFSSAVDGWAFTVKQFAAIYEKKLGFKRRVLERFLWGDYYLDPKTKRPLLPKHLKGRNLKTMFAQLVLEPIWSVYGATVTSEKGKGDPAMLEKITKSLSITLPPHVLRSRDPRAVLTAIFAAWLPISTALLVTVIEYLPSPVTSQKSRMDAIIDSSPGASSVSEDIRRAIIDFKVESNVNGGKMQEEVPTTRGNPVPPAVAYVSKMVAIPHSQLPENKQKPGASLSSDEAREIARKKRAEFAKAQAALAETNESGDGLAEPFSRISVADREASKDETTPAEAEDPEHLIGFARLYSGTLTVGEEIYVIPPKYNPEQPHASAQPTKTTITGLYLLMGRELEPLQQVPAGVVFGIRGLEGHLLKSGTICTQVNGAVNLAGINLGSPPIVRVALEPVHPYDLDKMIRGCKLLEQSDPCVEYEQLPSGEHVILTAGELHLERCLKDLRERFAKCEVSAGEPIVPYRESIVAAADMNPAKGEGGERGRFVEVSPNKQLEVRLTVRPLPAAVTDFLTRHSSSISKLYAERKAAEASKSNQANGESNPEEVDTLELKRTTTLGASQEMSFSDFRQLLKDEFIAAKHDHDCWKDVAERIVSFGPNRVGPNLLIDASRDSFCRKFLRDITDERHLQQASDDREQGSAPQDFQDNITYAFQLATARGPLCNEPVQGIAVFIDAVTIHKSSSTTTSEENHDSFGRLTGDVIRIVRDSIRHGFLDWSPRLLLAVYSCEIQTTTETLGKVYPVITRRRGRILAEAMKEGTPFFSVVAVIPVAESFGFSEEIRKRTSGAAQPQLVFAGFEMLNEDPFWVPFTEEELEDLGDTADRDNVAKKYMDAVRTRKGLFVEDKKLVVNAQKQKTLKK